MASPKSPGCRTCAAQARMPAHSGGVRATPARRGTSISSIDALCKNTSERVARQDKPSDPRGLRSCGDNRGAITRVTGALGDLGLYATRYPLLAAVCGQRIAVDAEVLSRRGGRGAARLPPPRQAPCTEGLSTREPVCLPVRKNRRRTARPRHRGRPWRAQREPFKNVNELIKISSFTSSCFTAFCPPSLSGGPREKVLVALVFFPS